MKRIKSLTDLKALLIELDWPKELILPRDAFNFVWERSQTQARTSASLRFCGVLIKPPPLTDKIVDLSREPEDD